MNLFRSFTDAEIVAMTKEAYRNAKEASKEGPGTGRGAGSNGIAANNWIDLATECKARGLFYK